MNKTLETIFNTIQEIQTQKSMEGPESLNEGLKVMDDLGFRSLDVAQLIAILGLKLEADPFSEGVPLAEVVTIADLKNAYQSSIDKAQGVAV